MSYLNNNPQTIQVRQGTAANLALSTTYLIQGELAYTTDTGQLNISDGTNKLRVATCDSSGRLGIGTTSPSYKLDVAPATSADAIHLRYSGDNGGYFNSDGPSGMYLSGGACYNSFTTEYVFRAKTATASGFIAESGRVVFWGNAGLTAGNTFTINRVFGVQSNGRTSMNLGTVDALSILDVNGNVAIGTYAGVTAAPTNGLIVSGNVGIANSNPGAVLDIGLAGTTLGTIRVEGNTSGYVQIQPAAAAGSWIWTLPATDGNANDVLITDGSGVTSWGSTSSLKIPKTLFDHYANAGNGTTVETDLYSDTTAASQLGSNGDKLETEYGGTFVSSPTATREVKLYFGGTAIFDTGALTLSLSSAWTLFASVIRVSSTVVRYMISFTTEGAALAAYTAVGELTGLTLSSTNVLKITGQAAGVGAATNDIVAMLGSISFVPAA